MKAELIQNIETLQRFTKQRLFLSMHINTPGKIILVIGDKITQDQMNDFISEFGNNAGVSYEISINELKQIIITISIK